MPPSLPHTPRPAMVSLATSDGHGSAFAHPTSHIIKRCGLFKAKGTPRNAPSTHHHWHHESP